METALTRLIGIEVPIIQAPIGTLTNPQLAAAVSNAGGLGMLALGGAEPDHLRRIVAETQALTGHPFGVNLNLRRPQGERVAAALEAGVRLVSLFWGDPSPHVAAVHAAGALVTSTAGSAAEARRHADAGVDVVIAQGWEAGGHVWGGVATLTGTNQGPWAGVPPSRLAVSLEVLIYFPWDPATERFTGERIWFDRGA